ncbi:MAG: CHAP domain-containing protein, partial [Candidatus Tyrphobacter sp.]
YNSGNGTWHLTYDSLNRVLAREDPDSVYSYVCYFADGSTHYAETAYQHSLDGNPSGCAATPPGIYASAFTYDADGDVLIQTSVHGGTYVQGSAPTLPTTQGIVQKFYDADDRLVEVKQPYDATTDLYQNPWITRYLYDLSQNGTQGSIAFDGQSITAHGNLYKTVELLPPDTTTTLQQVTFWYPTPSPSPIANTVYQDLQGTAFDALDRPTAKYSLVTGSFGTVSPPSNTPVVNAQMLRYDSDPTRLGLLSQSCNAVSQCQGFTYDARGSQASVTFSDSTPSRTMSYDPDGRTISVASSVFGAQSYTYDADGRLSTSQDPSSGGVTSPALLTHHYYADGREESLDVSSPALTQTGLFAYSYRQDGHLQTQAIDDASVSGIVNAGTTTLGYMYTAAGRMTRRTESGAGANGTPTTVSYDANGMETSNTTPGESLSGLEYGAEGERLGLLADGAPYQYTYNVRGELVTSPQVTNPPTVAHAWYANGAQIQEPYMGNDTAFWWDDRMGVMGAEFPPNSVDQWTYDNAGRLTYGGGDAFGETRSYDAENHTLSSTSTGAIQLQGGGQYNYGLQNVIAWGPNGHPIHIGGSASGAPSQSDTLHWNGNTLLFTTSSTGQLVDIKIGAQGDILPLDPSYKGLTFYDRDPAGGVMGCHNATGATYAGIADVYTRTSKSKYLGGATYGVSPCETGSGYNQDTGSPTMPTSIIWWSQAVWSLGGSYAPPPVGQGGVLGMPRTDGLTDGTDTIQGVRTYDSNAGTWTTPDAYAGNVDNPASQKSYMWNGNNPEAYSDPTGYLTQGQQQQIQAYLESSHSSVGWPWLTYCTQYILDVYQSALGINLAVEILLDYERNHQGYRVGRYLGASTIALNADNMKNYFVHMGEYTAWGGNRRLEPGDILFIDQQGKPGVDHVSVVEAVNASGAIRVIDESTGWVTEYKSWSDFQKAMAQQGMSVEGFGRVKSAPTDDSSSSGDDGVFEVDTSATTAVPMSI